MSFGSDPTRPSPSSSEPLDSVHPGQPDRDAQQPNYGQSPYEQSAYGQNPYGGQQPYEQKPYGQNPYEPSRYGQYPSAYAAGPYGNPYAGTGPSNGMGLTAMILGIAAIPTLLLCGVGFIAGILAVIFGFIGGSKVRKGEADNGGQALTGIICGAVAIILGIAGLLLYVGMAASMGHNSYG